MTPTGSSLTLFDDPFDDGPAKERNHLSGDKAGKSRYADPISPRTTSSSISTTKPRPIQGAQSLGQLAGYATSEEDEPEKASVQGVKKGRPNKTVVYKSAESVASDSSESETSQRPPQQVHPSRTTLAKSKQLQTSASPRHRKRAMGTVPHITPRSKIDDKTRKTKNMTAKKRPTSALASPIIAKRPNTKGGFVVDSESDAEGSGQSDQDDHGSQSRSSVRQPSHASESPSFIQASLRNKSSPISLPTKQLNKSRLNKLLGRAKAVSTAPKQKQLLVHTQRSATATPAPSTASHPTASLGLQQSAFLQVAGSGNADRAKRSTAASTMKEMKSSIQQAKVMDSSMSKSAGKASSISQEIQRPTVVIKDHNRVPTQTNANSTPATTAAAASSSSPLLQQHKPVPGASISRKRKNGTSSNKSTSLFQSTLDAARRDTIGNTQRTPPQASGREEQSIAKESPILTSTAHKPESIPQPYVKEHDTAATNATSKKQSSSAIQTPKASGPKAAQRAQHHTQASASKSGKPTSIEPKTDAASSKTTSSTPGQLAQKRKLDSISGGSGHDTTTEPKRPALSPATPLKRPGSTQVTSKADTTARSAISPEAIAHKVPAKTDKSPVSATTASDTRSNLNAARPLSRHKPASVLTSQATSTLVGRQGSSVATLNDLCTTPAVSQLPAHTRKAAINKPVKKCMTPMATLLPQAKPVDQPVSFVTIPTKSNSGKSPEPIEHASVAHEAAEPAQHNNPFSDVVTTSSLEPSVSLEQPNVNKSGDTILGGSSKGNMRHIAATPYPEKTSSLVVTTCPKEPRQVPEPGSTSEEQHESTLTISLPEVTPVVTPEHILSVTGKEPVSTFSTTVPKPAPSNELQATDLAESSILEIGPPVSIDRTENAVLRSDETPDDHASMEADSVNTTAVSVQRNDAIADASSVPGAANDHGPSYQPETAVERRDGSPLMSLKPASPKQMVINAPEIALTPPISPPIPGPPPLVVAQDSDEDVLLLSCSPKVSKEAQPYFEYSVFQKIWSSEQVETDVTAIEITVRPFTNIDEANAQAEKTFQGSPAHFIDAIVESSTKRDEHGCSIFNGTVTPLYNPTKKSHLKIWVQRDIVSKFANQTPQTLKGTSFISSTCYILRLFNLAEQADTEGSDGSDSDDSDPPTREPFRVYHPHTRPEIYTTLDAANRAARALQIELSHEKEPKDAFSKTFQEKNLRELNAKVLELQSAERDGGDRCWKSRFNACGRGGDSLEVVVEKTGICGPRNL